MAANVDVWPPRPQTQLARSWVDMQQMFALSLSPSLNGVPCFNDLMAASDGTTDGTWDKSGNPVLGTSVDGGSMGLGAFTEAAWIFPHLQGNSTQAHLKSQRHSPWYVCSRSSINIYCTNAGSWQALTDCAVCALTTGVNVILGYAPTLSATNWSLFTATTTTINSSVVTSEPRRLSSNPDRDFGIYHDGVSIKAYTGDLLNGLAMSQIGELTATEPLSDSAAFACHHVRITTEAGGPVATCDKFVSIGPTNR